MKTTKFNIILLIFIGIFLTGCGTKTGNDGINVNLGDDNISIGDDGINVNIGDDSISIGNNEINVNIGDDNVNIKSNEYEENETISCNDNYNKLLEEYGQNFSDCYFSKPDISSCEGNQSEKGKINLSIIFDASGSMGTKIGDETMMEIAKEKVIDYIDEIDENTNLSFILYGHKGSGMPSGKTESCDGVEIIYSYEDTNINSLTNKISNFQPNGYTPIANALIKANEITKKQAGINDKNIILLISDGIETCGGNPVVEALKISKTQNTVIDVIGFNVTGEAQKQLMDIANKGKGSYYDVKSKLDFEQTFNKTKNFLDAMSCGASKAAIELNYGAEAINKYYSCMFRLKEEQVYILTEADDNCKYEIENILETRYEKYESEFEDILEEGEEILDNFGDIIDEVEEKVDY